MSANPELASYHPKYGPSITLAKSAILEINAAVDRKEAPPVTKLVDALLGIVSLNYGKKPIPETIASMIPLDIDNPMRKNRAVELHMFQDQVTKNGKPLAGQIVIEDLGIIRFSYASGTPEANLFIFTGADPVESPIIMVKYLVSTLRVAVSSPNGPPA